MTTTRTSGTSGKAGFDFRYLFGPVNSRRLGISLGVDLVPYKTCTLNCAYCECGPTTIATLQRREYVPARELIDELDRFLRDRPRLDYITFAGSGEPTLNTALGAVADHVKKHYPNYRTALLTNATLFHLPEVRHEAARIDLVLPSLDAVSEEAFVRLNQPAPGLSAGKVVEGLIAFAREYTGTLWVEVFIVPGINDTDRELALLKEALELMAPARVQLNSLDRPAAHDWVPPATTKQLADIAERLQPLPVEIISRARPTPPTGDDAQNIESMILPLLRRRPCTVEDLAVSCRCEISRIHTVLARLVEQGEVRISPLEGKEFYQTTPGSG